MSANKNAEAAFPVPHQVNLNGETISYAEIGMTKRELIAMHLMAVNKVQCLTPGELLCATQASVYAADALLAELAK